MDAFVAATLTDHSSEAHGRVGRQDINGQAVPDGEYKLYIEVTEYEEQGQISFFQVHQRPRGEDVAAAGRAEVKRDWLTYTPMPGIRRPSARATCHAKKLAMSPERSFER